jgi:RHS repeat-associated protein
VTWGLAQHYDGAYAPYGENYAESGTTDRNFTGQNQDMVSSGSYPLSDFMFREYHSTWGRWVSPDPAGLVAASPSNPQSWNRYAYVGNSPTSFIDPTGLLEEVVCSGADGQAAANPDCAGGTTGPVAFVCPTCWDSSFFNEWLLCASLGQCRGTHDPPVPVDPKPRPGSGGGGGNGDVIAQAVSRAVNDLLKDDCAALFYTQDPAGALENAFKDNRIRGGPFGGNINPGVGAQTNAGLGVIYLASNRYFFTGQFNGGPVSQTTREFSGLTQNQVQETILIHEMLHLTGSVGADNYGQVIFPGNGVPVIGSTGVTSAVIQHCIINSGSHP